MVRIKFLKQSIDRKSTKNALRELGAENLRYLPNGKPVADNCFVSVTHSGDSAAVCASNRPIGIDMEKADAVRDFRKIAERFFSEKELEYYKENPIPLRFYEIWTRKEAYSKISGDGLKDIFRKTDTLSLDGYSFKTESCGEYVITVCEAKNSVL